MSDLSYRTQGYKTPHKKKTKHGHDQHADELWASTAQTTTTIDDS